MEQNKADSDSDRQLDCTNIVHTRRQRTSLSRSQDDSLEHLKNDNEEPPKEGEPAPDKQFDPQKSLGDQPESASKSSSEKQDEEEQEEGEAEGEEEEGEEEEEEEEQSDEEIEEIKSSLKFKRFHYILTCLVAVILFLFLLELSYTKSFSNNIYIWLIILQFIESCNTFVLQNYLLKENLLIQPINAAFETLQFVMFMASYNLQFFIISYVARICIIIFFRTYIDPVLKNIEFFLTKLAKFLVKRRSRFAPYFSSFLKPMVNEQTIRIYLGVKPNDDLFADNTSLENILNQLLSYSSKIHAIFIKPILMWMIKSFAKETQMPQLYKIRYSDFSFYLYFAIIVIIPQMICDIYVMNSLELIHGFKLFDYFSYCQYRYQKRQISWVARNHQLSKFLDIKYRSLDNMCFSDQFYFMGSVVVYGILQVVIGTSVIIRYSQRPCPLSFSGHCCTAPPGLTRLPCSLCRALPANKGTSTSFFQTPFCCTCSA